MGTYNAKVHHEQGGSALQVESGGVINIQAGGEITGTGAFAAGSVTIVSGGPLFLGTVQFMSATSSSPPGGAPVSAAPGSIFLRVDGSMSGLYVNISDGTAGSVWKTASGDAVMNT